MKNLNKIIKEEINKYLTENVTNEYLDKYYGMPLKRYLHMDDKDKCMEFIWNYSWFITQYLEDENLMNDVELSEINDLIENGDNEEIYNILIDRFGDKIFDKMSWNVCRYDNPPTYSVMDYTRDIHNDWLIHFSDNADDIYREGFKYATDDLNDLGYSGAGNTKGKTNEGWDFAYPINRIPNDCDKYGKNAVMFMASGIQARHYGDEEEQVMFWNNDAKNIVLIQNSNSTSWGDIRNTRGDFANEWYVSNYNGDAVYSSDDIDDVVSWVISNFAQYRKVLLNPKESKIRKEKMKKSSLNYGYKQF